MRQFVKLSDIENKFAAIGVRVSGMTYDDADTIQEFHNKWGLAYPLLRDVDGQHVDAWGIRMRNMAPAPLLMVFPIRASCWYPLTEKFWPSGQRLATDLEQIGKPSYRKLAVFWVLADNC